MLEMDHFWRATNFYIVLSQKLVCKLLSENRAQSDLCQVSPGTDKKGFFSLFVTGLFARTSLVSNGWFPFETSRSHWQISRLAAIKILLANQNIALKPHLSVSHPLRLARCLIWWSNAWDICLFCTKKLLEKCRVW